MKRKDERIQIYYRESETPQGTTRTSNYRHFIYSKTLYNAGGLFMQAAALSATDTVNSDLKVAKEPVKFTVNRNRKITNECKVIWNGVVYDISYVDGFDFRSRQITFVGIASADTTKYTGDRFDD